MSVLSFGILLQKEWLKHGYIVFMFLIKSQQLIQIVILKYFEVIIVFMDVYDSSPNHFFPNLPHDPLFVPL